MIHVAAAVVVLLPGAEAPAERDGLLLHCTFGEDEGEGVKDRSGRGNDGKLRGARFVAVGDVSVPSLAWATSYYYGEQYAYLKKGTELSSVFDLPEFRTELMGHPFGVPADFLFPHSGWLTERQTLAVTLLHDVLVRPHESIPALELTAALGRVSDRFDRKHAEWLPYWKNADYVSVKSAGAHVSLYRHKANGVLAVISNLNNTAQDVAVRFDVQRLGIGEHPSATDALDGSAIPMARGEVTFARMPSMEWKLIWVRP